jgi:ATP-dependent RNA helicase RhlE
LSFSEFSLSPEILRSITDRGYQEATPIQASAIPAAMDGRDLVATAETGSGKTAAYLIPLLERLHRGHQAAKRPAGISALVLVPTRELAIQVAREFAVIARHTRVKAAVIMGGDSMSRQLHELRNGAQVLIACPGRLIDHLDRKTVSLGRIEVVVIDEADRLLDMGFLPQLRQVMRTLPKHRQTLMFSATMASGVRQIASEFLNDPVRVRIGEKTAPPPSIRQTIYPATPDSKGPMLLELLKNGEVESAIIFTRTKSRADRVAKMLTRNGIKAVAIHGDRSQSQRNAALGGFRARTYRVMVATDLAARGIDVPHVSHVINFDLPDETENYIHRIGRTARMGKAGHALSLVTPEERASLARIERALGTDLERERVEGFEAPEISAPKPVKLFRSDSIRRRSTRSSRRATWA